MSNFLKAKKYYTKKELDEYVTKLMSTTEVTLVEQRERILALKQQNDRLCKELADRKKVDKFEKKNLEQVQEKCNEIVQQTEQKCKEELQQVKDFACRWYAKFDALVKEYDIKDVDIADKLVIETGAIAAQYGSPDDLENEDKRFLQLLDRVKQKRKANATVQLVEEKNEQPDDVFSIDEALNPVDPLEDILKDLLKK